METDTNALEGHGADSTPTYSCPITPGSRIFRAENNPFWKVEVKVGVFISGFEKKNEVMANRIGNDKETGGEREKLYGRGISQLLKGAHSENPSKRKTKNT